MSDRSAIRMKPFAPGDEAFCERVMRALPAWFGIEPAIVHYAEQTTRLPTWLAVSAGEAAGFIAVKQHTPHAAEIYVMGVLPEHHRRGVGRAMVRFAEDHLRADGTALLQVKTLGPSHSDRNYALTRRFYEAMGFLPVEEFPDLWPGNPCLLYIKALR